MAHVKTAVSVEKSLFEQTEALARRMRISRSRLFALALEDFIHRMENRELLKRINAACSVDRSEEKLRRELRRQHRKLVEGEW